jgi:hypothetical protein
VLEAAEKSVVSCRQSAVHADIIYIFVVSTQESESKDRVFVKIYVPILNCDYNIYCVLRS